MAQAISPIARLNCRRTRGGERLSVSYMVSLCKTLRPLWRASVVPAVSSACVKGAPRLEGRAEGRRSSAGPPGGVVLVLTRRTRETIMIGDDVEVTVVSVSRDKVRLGIQAPSGVPVHRREIYLAIKEGPGDEEPAPSEAGRKAV